MRRTSGILASLAALVGVTVALAASPASAHFCANPVKMRSGTLGAVNIGIAAERKPVVSVDVAIPPGFTVDHPVEYGPWKAATTGTTVAFSGGRIEPYTCAFFSVVGRTTRKGVFAFELTTHAEDGSSRHYTNTRLYDPAAAQLVYAGVPIPTAPVPAGDDRGFAARYGVALAVALGVGGLALGAVVLYDRRR